MNSIQNPSIRILLLIKTLTLNQLKKRKKNLRFIWLGWIGFEALERDYASLRWRNEIAQISNPKRRRELLRHLLHLLPQIRELNPRLSILLLLRSCLFVFLGFRKLRNFVQREKKWKVETEKRESNKNGWFRGGEFTTNERKGESDYRMWNYNL